MHRLARLSLGVLVASSALLSSPVWAEPQANHDHDHDHDHDSLEQRKHVHGSVTFNIALEGGRLAVELDAPADNVVGFEKSPRNETERKAVADANAWIASGRNIVGVPRNAGCRLQAVDFKAPTLGTGHADYRARFDFSCAQPGAIEWVELWALRRLLEVEKTEVNIVTATTQRQIELGAGSLRVSLK